MSDALNVLKIQPAQPAVSDPHHAYVRFAAGADPRSARSPRRRPRSLLLNHQHLRNRARSLPIGRVNLLDLPHLRPAIMLELRAAVPDRANLQILLAQIDRDLGSWPLQVDPRPVTDGRLPPARDGSDLNASRNASAPLLFGGGRALCVGEGPWVLDIDREMLGRFRRRGH
jgi:hypothetical protein